MVTYVWRHLLFIVSHDHCPCSVFLVNTLSVRYILSKIIPALCNKLCRVFLSVILAWGKIIPHCSLKSYIVTSVCLYDIWKVLKYVTSELPISIYSFLTSTSTYFGTFIDAVFLFILLIPKTQYFSS